MTVAFTQSRVFWFLVPQLVARLANFLLIAVLARNVSVDALAVFLAAYAFASLFEPLFSSSVGTYLMRLLRQAQSPEDEAVVMRSAYLVLQAIAVVVIGGVMLWELATPQPEPLSICILLFAMCTPLTLFDRPLMGRDQYLAVQPVYIVVKIAGTALRVGTFLLTGDLILVALLLSFDPLCSGLWFFVRTRARLLARPLIAPQVRRQLLAELPKLVGATFLAIAFWRSPVLLASWFLTPTDVVHIALSMQLVMGLCIVPTALTGSLLGPMVLAGRDDARFRLLCEIGSTISFLSGVASVIGVALFGDFVLVAVFGDKAIGAIDVAIWLSVLPFLAGLNAMTRSVANLHGRPADLVRSWSLVLLSQAGLAVMLWAVRMPELLAPWTMASFLIGATVLPFFLRSLRTYAGSVVFGFRRLRAPRTLAPQMVQVMLLRN